MSTLESRRSEQSFGDDGGKCALARGKAESVEGTGMKEGCLTSACRTGTIFAITSDILNPIALEKRSPVEGCLWQHHAIRLAKKKG
ncbi:hypothetical protein Tco_0648113 [Tanacetum coccineum]